MDVLSVLWMFYIHCSAALHLSILELDAEFVSNEEKEHQHQESNLGPSIASREPYRCAVELPAEKRTKLCRGDAERGKKTTVELGILIFLN